MNAVYGFIPLIAHDRVGHLPSTSPALTSAIRDNVIRLEGVHSIAGKTQKKGRTLDERIPKSNRK